MKLIVKKRIAICLAFALVIVILQSNQIIGNSKAEMNNPYNLSEPEIDSDGTVTWDCIYFGNYWQNDTNGDGTPDQKDNKEPIKWRVLSLDKDDAFLIADCALECQFYNEKDGVPVTWETCSLRTYLNETFIKNAFSDKEQAAIQTTRVITEANPEDGTDGGNDTEDKICVPSIQEMQNERYGFGIKFRDSIAAYQTDYSARWSSSGPNLSPTACWWLRSPAKEGTATVAGRNEVGRSMSFQVSNISVRPVLHLNLSATSQWLYAGQVTSWGEVSETKEKKTWDCVYFGKYWQNDTNGDSVADKKDQKEPIKWRILSKSGNKALLLADRCLDHQSYNEKCENITWETCSLRTWLNADFIKNAFTTEEQSAIFQTKLVNDAADNAVDGGNNTEDKVFLLSLDDMNNTEYGFYLTFDAGAQTRRAKNTEYAKANNAYTAPSVEEGGEGKGAWWLRTLGAQHGMLDGSTGISAYGAYVNYDGRVSKYGTGGIGHEGMGVRPAIYINLEKTSVWKNAGQVIWDGTVVGGVVDEPTQTPGVLATEEPTPTVLPPILRPEVTEEPDDTPVLKPSEKPSVTPPTSGTPTQPGTSSVRPPVSQPTSPAALASDISFNPGKVTIGKVSALKLKQKKNTVTASWKKLTGAKGYQISYSPSKKWKGEKQKLVTKNNAVVKNLKKKTTYYFRVRAYRLEGTKKVYGAWSSVKKIKIRK